MISFSLRNLQVRASYVGSTWVQPSHPASLRPSSVPGASLVFTHRLPSPLLLSVAVRQFGAVTAGTNGLAGGFNWQCTANDIVCHAVSWPQHACTPYRLSHHFTSSTVWVAGRQPGKGAGECTLTSIAMEGHQAKQRQGTRWAWIQLNFVTLGLGSDGCQH